MKLWNETLKPVAVLLVICILAGGCLAWANALTAPAIAANEEASRNAAYFAALPEADRFTALDCSIDGVTAVLRADNGTGYVVTAQARGYGGQVPAAVSFTPDGVVRSVVMLSNNETPGLGQKVTGTDFTAQFSGLPADGLTLDDIDAVSGATLSSRAAVAAIDLAMQAYRLAAGGTEA